VLAAMGVLTHGNVRVSLARATTEAEVERFLAVLPEVLHRLRAEVGL
jgi:cysteine desulfurase